MAERNQIIELIDQACQDGARLSKACSVLGIPARSIQRWRKRQGNGDGRKAAAQQRQPANKLSESERLLHLEAHEGIEGPGRVFPPGSR